MTKVSLIIVNYNAKENTLECLQSLRKLSTVGYQLAIIVVDNNSTDDSVVCIKKRFPKIEIIKNRENLGFVGGNNLGIRHALKSSSSKSNSHPEYLLILNNDTLVSENLITELIKKAEKDSRVGIVSPKIYFAKGYEFHKDRYKKSELGKVIWYAGGKIDWQNMYGYHEGVDQVDEGQFNQEKEVDFATGCCMLIKRQICEKVGLFDKKFFLYNEDLDLSLRMEKKGYKVVYEPKAYLWHKNAGSSSSGSALQDYYLSRNRLLIGWRYAPWRTKLALFRESMKRLFTGRSWEKKGIRDFYLRKFGKGSYKS